MSQDFFDFDPDTTHLETAPCTPPAAPTPTEAEMRRDKAREMRDQLAAHMNRSAARAGLIPDPEHAHHVSAMRARQEVMTQHGLPDRAWDDAPGITGHDKVMLEVVVKEAVREAEARITKSLTAVLEARLDAWEERLLARVGDRLLDALDARMDARMDAIAQVRGAREAIVETSIEDVLDSIGDTNTNEDVEAEEDITFETLLDAHEAPVHEALEDTPEEEPVPEETPDTTLTDVLTWDTHAPFLWRHRQKPVWRMTAICLGHPGVKGGLDEERLIFASVDGRWGVSIPRDAWHQEANGWAWEEVERGTMLSLHWPETFRGMSGRIEPERAVRIDDLSIVRETKDAHAVYVKTRSGIATYLDLNVITASTSPVEVGAMTTVWALPSRMRMGKRSKGWMKMITLATQNAAKNAPPRTALVAGEMAASEVVAKAALLLEGEGQQ